jgi:beta-glucosidase
VANICESYGNFVQSDRPVGCTTIYETIMQNYLANKPSSRLRWACAWLIAATFLFATAALAQDAAASAEKLLARMTLDEKLGQMTQVDMLALENKSDIQKYFLGSVLSGGGSDPADISAKGWLAAVTEYQTWAMKTRLKIPLLYGIDAVHGHNNVDGAVIFPHNIGLGAMHDAALVEQAARVTAEEVAGTGIRWAFAPCVAVAQNVRWGRTYESFGDDPKLTAELGAAAVKGFQGTRLSDPSAVLACAKHFIGDGGTADGVDQGNAVGDEAMLRKLYLPAYAAAIQADVGSIMVSYSSWNGQKMHGNKYLLTDVLKGELGFKGFLVSDWAAIDQLSKNYKQDIELSVNAGIDMVMIPNGPGKQNNYVQFITLLKELVAEGKVPQSRIDDAVKRILTAKFRMNLFENSATDPKLTAAVGSDAHRQVARECVQRSLVLLKNADGALPLSKDVKRLAVVGAAADDLGRQCGGWTISWQGNSGAVTRGGTTILNAIRHTVGPHTEIIFSPDGAAVPKVDAIVVVVGEMPYAEMKGDSPKITVILSGRPLVLGPAVDVSDAVVAAWLPGTEGQGVADVLFGDFRPSGKLPRPWPGDQGQPDGKPLFARGFGLTYKSLAQK